MAAYISVQVLPALILASAILALIFSRSARFALVSGLAFQPVQYLPFSSPSCWWITQHFRTVFASTWNLKYQSSTSTRFSRRGYMAQVVPSLMMTMALRHAFDIPGGEGRIQNVDESMCYMFNSAKRSWTV